MKAAAEGVERNFGQMTRRGVEDRKKKLPNSNIISENNATENFRSVARSWDPVIRHHSFLCVRVGDIARISPYNAVIIFLRGTRARKFPVFRQGKIFALRNRATVENLRGHYSYIII